MSVKFKTLKEASDAGYNICTNPKEYINFVSVVALTTNHYYYEGHEEKILKLSEELEKRFSLDGVWFTEL